MAFKVVSGYMWGCLPLIDKIIHNKGLPLWHVWAFLRTPREEPCCPNPF